MLIKELNKNHAVDVAKLKSKVCNTEYEEEYKKYMSYFDDDDCYYYIQGIFSKGDLKGYIVNCRASRKTNKTYLDGYEYLLDLVCINPLYLKSLLISYFNFVSQNGRYCAEVNVKCYPSKVMYNIIKKLESKNIIILESNLKDYEDNEPIQELTFKLVPECLDNYLTTREKIHQVLLSSYRSSMDGVISSILVKKVSLDDIIRNKKWILYKLNQMNIDAAMLLGDSLNLIIERHYKAKDAEEKIAAFKEDGYIEVSHINYEPNYIFKSGPNLKIICRQSDNKAFVCSEKKNVKIMFKETASDYRSQVIGKIKNFKNIYPSLKRTYLLDKYNNIVATFNSTNLQHYRVIPYYFSNLFDYKINRLKFYSKIENERLFKSKNSGRFYSLECAISNARKCLGENMALKVYEAKNPILTTEAEDHDYSYPVQHLLGEKPSLKLLTKGAIFKVLMDYTNEDISKVNNMLRSFVSLPNGDLSLKKAVNKIDTKSLRKEISKLIRKYKLDDALELMNKIVSDAISKQSEKLEKKFLGKDRHFLPEFLNRMNRYINGYTVSLNNLLDVLGKDIVKDIVKGTYPGLFQPKDFYLNNILGEEVQNIFLNSPKTKKLKKLYYLLNKIKPVEGIFKGNLSKEEIEKVITILKDRNFTITKGVEMSGKLYAKIEPKCSPEFLTSGNASCCCMSFGAHNLVTYSREKGFGIINFYYNDRVIANSVIWINDVSNSLVIDNVEVAPNYKKEDILNSLKIMYEDIIIYLLKEYKLDFAVQGSSYNDLALYDKESYKKHGYIKNTIKARDVKENLNFYSDAKRCIPIDIKKLGITFNYVKEKMEQCAIEFNKDNEGNVRKLEIPEADEIFAF